MAFLLAWLAARAIRLRLSLGHSPFPRLVAARMQPRELRDIGLTAVNVQNHQRHFANAEAQLGMIR